MQVILLPEDRTTVSAGFLYILKHMYTIINLYTFILMCVNALYISVDLCFNTLEQVTGQIKIEINIRY